MRAKNLCSNIIGYKLTRLPTRQDGVENRDKAYCTQLQVVTR